MSLREALQNRIADIESEIDYAKYAFKQGRDTHYDIGLARNIIAELKKLDETPLTVVEGQQLHLCRVCREKGNPRTNPDGSLDSFISNFGQEYAHESCLKELTIKGQAT